MDPDPAFWSQHRRFRELHVDALSNSGPSHHGHTVNSVSSIARLSPSQAIPSSRTSPTHREMFLASAIALIEIVIARAQNDTGETGEPREVFFHHHDLGAEIDRRADIERIAGKDHDVELGCSAEQPVKLRQRVVQVCNDQTAHGACESGRARQRSGHPEQEVYRERRAWRRQSRAGKRDDAPGLRPVAP